MALQGLPLPLVLPGMTWGVEPLETAANPAHTIKARMDERSSDFIGSVS